MAGLIDLLRQESFGRLKGAPSFCEMTIQLPETGVDVERTSPRLSEEALEVRLEEK